MTSLARCTAVALVLAWGTAARGLVNPQLQPSHIVERHTAVLGGEIVRADFGGGVVVFRVTRICFGEFAPKEVTIRVPAAEDDEASLFDDAKKGGIVVAYVGKRRQRHEHEVLLYAGDQWHRVEMPDLAKPGTWEWKEALGDEMAGTFNGAAGQLLAMMEDAAKDRAFFPAYPSVKFQDDLVVGTFEGPVRGVALYDIDADGKLDIFACHETGSRAFLQTGPLKFEDRTAPLGLTGVKCVSCSFADVNDDDWADLLADGVIHLGSRTGFRQTELLPVSANKRVKCAAFVEIDRDGYPDVVVSHRSGGLTLYLNPGSKGGAFIDFTAASGLNREENGAGQTGFFAPGDWNGDGWTDLYYGVRNGLILVQDEEGVFSPVAHRLSMDYRVAGSREPGLTGGGCFAPLWWPDGWDLVAAGDAQLTIATNCNGVPTDVTGRGNETKVCRVSQLATLAEDLNMDGHVDLFTITRAPDARNVFHANRGYGSYMLSELYMDYDGFPGKAYTVGAGGAAAGDVNGDGANDLLLGGVDGRVTLMVNDTLSLRRHKEHPTYNEKTLLQTRLLTVRVKGGYGVLGAKVTLLDANWRVVTRRMIGSAVLTGCRGPDAVSLAVREPGKYTVLVEYASGYPTRLPVDLTTKQHVVLTVDRTIEIPQPPANRNP